MEINVGNSRSDAQKIDVVVDFYYQGEDGFGRNVEVRTWVDNVDSRSESYKAAKHEALKQLKKAVEALEKEL
ncbi:hypothetical protein [uncultured Kushneria sp.]|uniref:hypothetical protein n=1 Tax=uncultured Kushneria sp. TaxID=905033 RepID=UPI00260ABEF4|nr:hypothetical protein [uncultured Kushneria sp.]